MKVTNVYKSANIEEDSCYYVQRIGVRSTLKYIGENIEDARAYIENKAKEDFKNGTLAHYYISNGYCQEIEDYFTVDIQEAN